MTLANPNSHDSGDTTSVTLLVHGGFARASTPSFASVGRVIGRSRCSSTFTRASLPVGRTTAWRDSYGASRDSRRRRGSSGQSPPPLSYCGPAAQGERYGCHCPVLRARFRTSPAELRCRHYRSRPVRVGVPIGRLSGLRGEPVLLFALAPDRFSRAGPRLLSRRRGPGCC
jgi:hypothetical protein